MLCRRWLLKLRMRNNNNTNNKTDENSHDHPATNSVKNYLSGSERCLVVWGLSDSLTILCCQNIAKDVIHEKGLAKIFRCDEIARRQTPMKQFFLDTVACKTLDDFVRYLPGCPAPAWLIFDAVDQLNADTIMFFQDLIQLSYESSKFKMLLFTHKTDIACSVLRWSDSHRPIQMVEPIDCCQQQWKEQQQHLDQFNLDNNNNNNNHDTTMRILSVAGDIEAQWTLGIARLNHFLRDEWAQSGAFTSPMKRLVVDAL